MNKKITKDLRILYDTFGQERTDLASRDVFDTLRLEHSTLIKEEDNTTIFFPTMTGKSKLYLTINPDGTGEHNITNKSLALVPNPAQLTIHNIVTKNLLNWVTDMYMERLSPNDKSRRMYVSEINGNTNKVVRARMYGKIQARKLINNVYGISVNRMPWFIFNVVNKRLDPEILHITRHFFGKRTNLKHYNFVLQNKKAIEPLMGVNRNVVTMYYKVIELERSLFVEESDILKKDITTGKIISTIRNKTGFNKAEWKIFLNISPLYIQTEHSWAKILNISKCVNPSIGTIPAYTYLEELRKTLLYLADKDRQSVVYNMVAQATKDRKLNKKETAQKLPIIVDYVSHTTNSPKTINSAYKKAVSWQRNRAANLAHERRMRYIRRVEAEKDKLNDPNLSDEERDNIIRRTSEWKFTINDETPIKVGDKEFIVKPLNSMIKLAEESALMGNCIGGMMYVDKCSFGESECYHMDDGDGNPVASIEISKDKIRQARKQANGILKGIVKDASEELLRIRNERRKHDT